MSTIREFIINEPPTADGVRERTLASLGALGAARNILRLLVLPAQEVPTPTEEELVLLVRRPTYSAQGNMTTVEGTTVQNEALGNSVVIQFPEDLTRPATASVVTA